MKISIKPMKSSVKNFTNSLNEVEERISRIMGKVDEFNNKNKNYKQNLQDV
jgi:peptidoglycan hydrolase CwlO-like protein